jgi:6-pyruvoyltetrahydropterin/6-carboxytetrahydropterin synthase
MEISKEFRFEAAHILPKHPGKCARLHGHSWVLRVGVEGAVNKETGFVIDYADISKAVKPIIQQLDHRFLGQRSERLDGDNVIVNVSYDYDKHIVLSMVANFYPSSENLCFWIGDQLDDKLVWDFIEINETCTSSARLTRVEWSETPER